MEGTAHLGAIVTWSGFVLAFIFGAVGMKANFCTMGAVSDIVNIGDWGRMRMWLLAIAVAIIGAHILEYTGLIDLSKSIYPRPDFIWLSYIVGGFLFGVGMTLGSGCGSRTLMRIGGGNMKSVIVFVFLAISAYMTLRGLFGLWRVEFLQPVAVNLSAYGFAGQDIASLLTKMTGVAKPLLDIIIASIVAAALLIFVFVSRDFRRHGEYILGGVVIGLVVVAGWYLIAHIGYQDNPDTLEKTFFGTQTNVAESFSFVAPLAYTLQLLMLWTDSSLHFNFDIAIVVGMIAGAFAYAVFSRTFRWESFADVKDLGAHMLGGTLMGFGGVTALGCTIGQGISGFSTLAVGSIMTFLSIIAGAALTMKYQYWRLMREA
jgi:uncharacterized membrane protein YedE/YeeE